jgi:hypothetical protein
MEAEMNYFKTLSSSGGTEELHGEGILKSIIRLACQ